MAANLLCIARDSERGGGLIHGAPLIGGERRGNDVERPFFYFHVHNFLFGKPRD